eukprot:COSAG02_NODE_14745_length_1240_cov_1.707274_1_plen_61_part_00
MVSFNHEPWASLLAGDSKQVESDEIRTRGRRTTLWSRLLVHSLRLQLQLRMEIRLRADAS